MTHAVTPHLRRCALALLITTALPSAPALADTILGIQGGIGLWQPDFSGEVGDGMNDIPELEDLNIDSDGNVQAWAQLEHFIPLLPNIRLMYSQVEADGDSRVKERFSLGGIIVDANVRVVTEMSVTHLDGTLYYELLDNWVTLDLGLTVRYFDGYVQVESELSAPARSEMQGVIPMLYGKARFDLPFSGLWVEAIGSGAAYDGDEIFDLSAAIGYEVSFTPLLKAGVSLGYRRLDLTVANFGDFYADISATGPYLEANLRF